MKLTDRSLTFIVFICFSTMLGSFPDYVSPRQTWAASERELMIEGAKKEGKVTWYTTLVVDVNETIRKAFEQKYPFLRLEIYKAGNTSLLAKVENEARAGRHLWDVISIAGFQTYILKKKNFLARYLSPEAAAIPENFRDWEASWAAIYINPLAMGYNTRLVSPKEAPQSYDDLLNPKWKGKMAFDAKDVEWFANMLKIRGEKEGLEFMRKLARQNLRLMEGHFLQAQLMAAGEFPLAINLYYYKVEELKEQHAPVDWVPFNPVIAYLYAGSLSANAPHPHGARLLLDFLLSREGQAVLARSGVIPARTDVPPKFLRLVKGIKFWPSDISIAVDYNRYLNQFREIFLKGGKTS